MGNMTQEQKVNRGTIIIFILSIVLVFTLCGAATLAYFAGKQGSNITLIMGGPVRVSMVNNNYEETKGSGSLVMNLKANRTTLVPGIGIDMQAIAKLTSSDINSTPALLRAILDIGVTGISASLGKDVELMIRNEMNYYLTLRRDSTEDRPRDGWVLFDDGNYYYCSQNKQYDPVTNQEYITLKAIDTNAEGNNIPFINGTFQFPRKMYTNTYANVDITFKLTFQAIQDKLVNDDGDRIPNTIFNVKQLLDHVDWTIHNH